MPAITLAVIAVAAAAFSPVAPTTTVAGLAQRVLAAAVFGWVLSLAVWIWVRIRPSGTNDGFDG